MVGNKAFIKKYRYWLLLNGLVILLIFAYAFKGINAILNNNDAIISILFVITIYFLSTIIYQWFANRHQFLFYLSWLIVFVMDVVLEGIMSIVFIQTMRLFNQDYYYAMTMIDHWSIPIMLAIIIAYVIEVIIKQIQKPIKN